jgi:hypothetical protein
MSQPNPNTLEPLPEALSTMLAYPIKKIRKDMGMAEYADYKKHWDYFTTVWSYNYTVSTLNGIAGKPMYRPWQHPSNEELLCFRNGQIAHASVYSNAPMGQFDNFY